MSLLEATEWIKEYKEFMAHNATSLEHHEAKVPRELLEVNIDPTMKMKLRSKATYKYPHPPKRFAQAK